MSAWVLAIGGFAMLVVLHEAGHFFAAKAVGMRVERFFLFFPPKLVSVKRGETEYGIGAIPLGGFVKITGMTPEEEIPEEVEHRAYYRQPVWKRIVVIGAGPLVNIVLALVIFFILAASFGLDGEPTNEIGRVADDLPAAEALQSGDQLVAVDGKDISGLRGEQLTDRVRGLIGTHECAGNPADGCEAKTPATLTIVRDGERQTVEVTPVYDVPTAEEQEAGLEPAMRIGFGYAGEREPQSAAAAAEFSVDRAWFITTRTAEVFSRILDAEQRKEITGVVGATEVTRQSFEFDTRQAIFVLGVISLSLGLINLLPFLPLDGGHIFWSIVEKVRGRRPSLQTMERASFVGFALVLMLFVIGLNNDIGRITGEGFNVR
ncbi:MAG TPA: M50 family metallopeptidase [Solirubrobacterales bacterium]|nr:M50 family metallopeptidase [Solirubrobacterales bacterium]